MICNHLAVITVSNETWLNKDIDQSLKLCIHFAGNHSILVSSAPFPESFLAMAVCIAFTNASTSVGHITNERLLLVTCLTYSKIYKNFRRKLARSRLKWVGCMERMEEEWFSKRAEMLRAEGRRRERPHLKWEDFVKRDFVGIEGENESEG